MTTGVKDHTQEINPIKSVPVLIPLIGKFRPRLIELTSFKPKLLIKFIMNKFVKTNKHQYHAVEKNK